MTHLNPAHFHECKNLSEVIDAYHAEPTKNLVLRDTILSKEDVLRLAMVLGDEYLHPAFDEVREIKFDPSFSAKSIALSSGAHPPHLDGTFTETPPASFVLSFVQCDPNGGGTSLFWSIAKMLAEMPTDIMETLRAESVRYARTRHSSDAVDEVIRPLLQKDTYGRVIFRWRDDSHVQPESVGGIDTALEEAITWVRDYLTNSTPIAYQAEPGDTFIVRQRFYLHGRSPLSSNNSPRLAYRTWIH